MTVVKLNYDELFPVYYVSESSGIEVDIAQSLLDRWEKVSKEWEEYQNILGHQHDLAKKVKLLEDCNKNGIPSKGF